MATLTEPLVLSRSGVFSRLGSLLSDVSSNYSSEPPVSATTDQTINNSTILFDTSFAHLAFRQDLSTLEHVHIRCRPASSFNATIHTSLCEAVLGIYPDTGSSTTSKDLPVLVRGVNEQRHRRIKTGDWLLAINDHRLHWNNLQEILGKYRSTRKVRLTIRHPIHYNSTFITSLQPPIVLPMIEEKKITLPESLDCIHGVLFYRKGLEQGFQLVYQQPSQKDIFFAAGGLFPTLTQLMHDMNEHDSLLRSITMKLAEQIVHVCVTSDDNEHYLILIYPPIPNLHVCLLEQQTQQLIRLIKFLFGSIQNGFERFSESIDYFFQILFYRLSHLTTNSSSNIFKRVRLIDEFLPAQFDSYGTCPKLFIHDQKLRIHIDTSLNRLECQNFNQCSNDDELIPNRYRRNFFVTGSVLFHRFHQVTSHLSNELTMQIYRFLLHYGHMNISQIPVETWQFLLFKEIFPHGLVPSRQRSFLIVSCHQELTLAVIMETEFEKNYSQISLDHDLIQQIKLTMTDIASVFPPMMTSASPWLIASPANFLKKQLKRTISLPLIGGFNQSASKDSNLDDTISLASSQFPDPSLTDLRMSQLVSQPESQDELYKSNRESIAASTLSLDEQPKTHSSRILSYRLHPGPHSTIFYYLDYQSVRSLLIAPYFTLDQSTQTTLIERYLFETIQRTCIYLRQKHFARTHRPAQCLFSTKLRPKYQEIACQFSLPTDSDKSGKKKKDGHQFNFWIVGRKISQPVEHEFFVCYHDSVQQNITELAFTIAMSSPL